MDLTKPLLTIATILSGAASLFFGALFGLAWWDRHLFNAEGRYFNEASAVVHHDQSMTLLAPALAFLLMTLLFGLAWRIRRRKTRQQAEKQSLEMR